METTDDIIIQMGNGYGGIRTEYEQDGGYGEIRRGVLKRTKFAHRNAEKSGLKYNYPMGTGIWGKYMR